MNRPTTLNSLKFSDADGNILIREELSIEFTYHDDMENYMQSRYAYWTEVLDKMIVMAPDHNETMAGIEINRILRMFARKLGIPVRGVRSRSRKADYIEARRMIINYCSSRGIMNVTIADALSYNHATVGHHIHTHNNLMEMDKRYRDRYTQIAGEIGQTLIDESKTNV